MEQRNVLHPSQFKPKFGTVREKTHVHSYIFSEPPYSRFCSQHRGLWQRILLWLDRHVSPVQPLVRAIRTVVPVKCDIWIYGELERGCHVEDLSMMRQRKGDVDDLQSASSAPEGPLAKTARRALKRVDVYPKMHREFKVQTEFGATGEC